MKKLFRQIHLLNNSDLPYCNCLYIQDDIHCLVDSSPSDQEMVHIDNSRIDLIVNSHGHADHCWRNYSYPNARILLHPSEHLRVAYGEEYLKAYGFDHFPDESIRPFYLDVAHYHPRTADGELLDGQILTAGNIEFQVLHLPGHSCGHCGFIFPREGFIFTADINVEWKPFYAMVDSNIDDFIQSIETLIKMQPDMLVAGHGNAVSTRQLSSKLRKYRDEMYIREERVLKLVRSGKHSVREIAVEGPVLRGWYRNNRQQIYFLHECVMDWKHLQRLERLDKVFCENNKYYPL